MSQYKLTYFAVRALGEPIRWLFAYTGIPFEDDRINWDYPAWFQMKKKEFMDNGAQIPILTLPNGKTINQSIAIIRYLAAENGLLGDSSWAEARNDQIIHMIFDLFINWRSRFFVPGEEMRQKMKSPGLMPGKGIDDQFNICYSKINNMLEESTGKFINGDKLTYADLWLASFLNIWDDPAVGAVPVVLPGLPYPSQDDFYLNLTEKYPKLKQHKETVMAIPQIKKWIEQRPKTMA